MKILFKPEELALRIIDFADKENKIQKSIYPMIKRLVEKRIEPNKIEILDFLKEQRDERPNFLISDHLDSVILYFGSSSITTLVDEFDEFDTERLFVEVLIIEKATNQSFENTAKVRLWVNLADPSVREVHFLQNVRCDFEFLEVIKWVSHSLDCLIKSASNVISAFQFADKFTNNIFHIKRLVPEINQIPNPNIFLEDGAKLVKLHSPEASRIIYKSINDIKQANEPDSGNYNPEIENVNC